MRTQYTLKQCLWNIIPWMISVQHSVRAHSDDCRIVKFVYPISWPHWNFHRTGCLSASHTHTYETVPIRETYVLTYRKRSIAEQYTKISMAFCAKRVIFMVIGKLFAYKFARTELKRKQRRRWEHHMNALTKWQSPPQSLLTDGETCVFQRCLPCQLCVIGLAIVREQKSFALVISILNNADIYRI